jgi:lipopolysaccharide transport system permease protein
MTRVEPVERPSVTRRSRGHISRLSELWEHRELLRSLVVRNLKVKYQRSALGFVWTLLNPLLTVAVLVVVFSHVVKIDVPGYWAFLLSGYFVWNFAVQMLTTSTTFLVEHARLRRSVAFPLEVPLFAAAGSRLVEFAVELSLALLGLVIFYHQGVPASYILLPLLLVLQVLIVTGLSLCIATLAGFYNDVQHVIPVLLLMLFYLSPVFYPASIVPPSLQPLYYVNPIAGLLTAYHTVLYQGQFPSLLLMGGLIAAALVLSVLGYRLFNRFKPTLVELV